MKCGEKFKLTRDSARRNEQQRCAATLSVRHARDWHLERGARVRWRLLLREVRVLLAWRRSRYVTAHVSWSIPITNGILVLGSRDSAVLLQWWYLPEDYLSTYYGQRHPAWVFRRSSRHVGEL